MKINIWYEYRSAEEVKGASSNSVSARPWFQFANRRQYLTPDEKC